MSAVMTLPHANLVSTELPLCTAPVSLCLYSSSAAFLGGPTIPTTTFSAFLSSSVSACSASSSSLSLLWFSSKAKRSTGLPPIISSTLTDDGLWCSTSRTSSSSSGSFWTSSHSSAAACPSSCTHLPDLDASGLKLPFMICFTILRNSSSPWASASLLYSTTDESLGFMWYPISLLSFGSMPALAIQLRAVAFIECAPTFVSFSFGKANLCSSSHNHIDASVLESLPNDQPPPKMGAGRKGVWGHALKADSCLSLKLDPQSNPDTPSLGATTGKSLPYQPGCSSCEPSSHTLRTHLPPLVPLRCSGGPQTSDDHRCRANSGLQTLGLGWAHPTRRHSPGSSLGRPLVHLFASATSLSGSSCVMTQWRDCLTGWNPPLQSSGSLCKRPMHSESCLHE